MPMMISIVQPISSAGTICEAWKKRTCIIGSFEAASIATRKPRYIPTPPSRGVGVVCTSRSRSGVHAPKRKAPSRTGPVAR